MQNITFVGEQCEIWDAYAGNWRHTKHLNIPIIFWLTETCTLSVDLLIHSLKRVEVIDIWVIELNSNTSSGFSNISCISHSGVSIFLLWNHLAGKKTQTDKKTQQLWELGLTDSPNCIFLLRIKVDIWVHRAKNVGGRCCWCVCIPAHPFSGKPQGPPALASPDVGVRSSTHDLGDSGPWPPSMAPAHGLSPRFPNCRAPSCSPEAAAGSCRCSAIPWGT